ncbi:GPI transamidase component PIG-T [Phakopsora pachyrhizi]|nr:GPI transamidase component PIG-T [Phakopsora pachyrhizi]
MNTTTLINSLAGIFCASLNRLELSSDDPPSDLLDHLLETTTRSRDHHHWNHSEGGNSVLHHGILPIEQPCTENLTPLIRLLPCDKRAGLASLVDSHRIFDSNWQSLRLKILNRPDGLDLRIEIEAVLNPIREISIRNWSFKSIFGKSIESKCPLASTSKVEIIENQKNSLIEPRATEDGLAIDGKHTFDIMRAVFPLEIEMKWPNEFNFIHPKQYDLSPIEVKRIITGYGQNRGKLGVEIKFNENKIRSNDEEKDFVGEKEDELIYFEQFPWWLSIYLHTLTIKIDDHPINPNEVILEKKIKASLQRERSYLITLKLKHPDQLSEDAQRRRKGSMRENGDGQIRRMRIDFEYEKDLLLYTEYSSDANRGFDLSPALVIHNKLELVNNSGSITSSRNSDVEADFITDGEGRRIKTKSSFYWSTCGLISLATPDFSMPYNVIIVTSTVIALFFGSVFNLLVREFKIVKIKNSSK